MGKVWLKRLNCCYQFELQNLNLICLNKEASSPVSEVGSRKEPPFGIKSVNMNRCKVRQA